MARSASSIAVLLALLAGSTASAESPSGLVRQLSERRPDVVRWETRPIAPGEVSTSQQVIAVGRTAARMPVRFADGRVHWYVVAGFRPVPVTRHALAAGDPVTPEAVTHAERDVIASVCSPVEWSTGERWRASRRLAAGEALCSNNVEAVPEVERDHAVTLSTERGGVAVSRQLTAAADARIGERVRLRDRISGATVVAIVTGPAAARVPE